MHQAAYIITAFWYGAFVCVTLRMCLVAELRAMYIADSDEFVPDSIAYSIKCKWCTR